MNKIEIITAINDKIRFKGFSVWRIGVTQNPEECRRFWNSERKLCTSYWSDWQADSVPEAKEIEQSFTRRGMRDGSVGELSPHKPTYVYLF